VKRTKLEEARSGMSDSDSETNDSVG